MTEHKPAKIRSNYIECSCGWVSGIEKFETLNRKYVEHLGSGVSI